MKRFRFRLARWLLGSAVDQYAHFFRRDIRLVPIAGPIYERLRGGLRFDGIIRVREDENGMVELLLDEMPSPAPPDKQAE